MAFIPAYPGTHLR